MTRIQVHYEQPDGRRGVINYLTGENAEVSAAPQNQRDGKRKQLLARAASFAAAWSAIFPNDKIFVADLGA